MMMHSASFRAIAIATVAAAAHFGCGQKEEPPKPAPQAAAPAAPPPPPEIAVKIGVVAPLTGPQAHIGKDMENAVRLAVEEANAAGHMIDGKKAKFEVISEDDQADPKIATVVAQKLVDAKVNAIVGHFNSGTTIPASKIYNDGGIPHITPSATNPKLTEQGFKTTFRLVANDNQQGKVLGEYAVKDMKAKAIAIIDDRTAYGQGLADVFEKTVQATGGKIVAREFTTDKSTDFKAILTKIKGRNPDILFFGGIDTQGGPMLQQMKALGIKAKYLGGDGIQSSELFKLGGDATDGVLASFPGLPSDKMEKAFADRYKAKWNQDVVLYAPQGYDCFSVFLAAMKKAGSIDPVKYLPALAATDLKGITGPLKFDDKGDVKDGPITIFEAKGGKWVALTTIGGPSIVGIAAGVAADAAKGVTDAAKDAASAVTGTATDAAKAAAGAAGAAGDALKGAAAAAKDAANAAVEAVKK